MILIDLNNNENKLYNIYQKNIEELKIVYTHISFNIKYIENNKDSNIIQKIKNINNKLVIKYYVKSLKKELNEIYNDNKNLNVIISNKILDKNILEYINYILNNIFNDKLRYIKKTNTLLDNTFKYLEKFNVEDKVCILTNELEQKYILKYVERFKYIDIVIVDTNCKNNISKLINKINNEYGTTIKIINDYNLTKYNICVINTKVNINLYNLNKYVYKLNLINSDNDIYSLENKIYNKYKDKLLNKEEFSSNKIGQVFLKYLTNSV